MVDSRVERRTTLCALLGIGEPEELGTDGETITKAAGTIDRSDVPDDEPPRVNRAQAAPTVSRGRLTPLLRRT
jgi:hypothetical protein